MLTALGFTAPVLSGYLVGIILNLKELSTQDNYFDFGADSLSCIKLIAEISNKFKITVITSG